MTVSALIRAELARLVATPLARLALVALMLVPVLYGGLYLWANRDPYAGLDRVPAAIVVLDRGATITAPSGGGTTTVDYGHKVADRVIADRSFDWHLVSARDATMGVTSGKYDFSVTLPASFSADLVSSTPVVGADGATQVQPRRADIQLVTNDTNSYLASTIAAQAGATIRTSIASQVSSEAAGRFLLALSNVRDSLAQAADGASQLAAGAASAQSGAQTLSDGTASLAGGAAQVAAGTQKLASTGDRAVAAGTQLIGQIPALRAQLQTQLAGEGLTQSQIDGVLAQLDPLAAKAGSAQAQLNALAAQVDQLNAGAQQVSAGAAQAHSGAASLTSGLSTIDAGARDLQSSLANGVTQLPNTTAAQRDSVSSTIGDPVTVDRTAITEASDYGAGLAPFFISLAAWIGIYALFLIVKPLSRRALTAVQRPLRVTLAGWLTPGILGLLQMVAVFLIVTLALGFAVANPIGALAFMVLISLAFAAVILALNVWLGSVGQFLGLVLMVVQLVTAGGTFPWQTLPAPLAALHHVLPMSYAVDGLRQLMYGGSVTTALMDAGVLALWLTVAFCAAAAGATRMTRFRTLRDLRPSLIG